LTTGSTFAGRFQIIEELGKGGMGKVYKAVDTRINEKIAIKLIKPEIATDKKTLERFGNELKLARKIAHKNVGKMFDINEEQGTHYITMEYVSGQDLKGLIKQTGQLALGTSISIAKQICEGLSEAHKVGVIHRDLKPNNIMIDREGEVRIMDFGIARSLKEKGITEAGVMIGTPEYMSPEQAEAKEVDQRSDLYSLGVILYEMVTGRVPFEGDTALSIAMKHKGESPKDPKEYNTQTPNELSSLVLKCLEKDKGKRYQCAGELHSDLENVEKGIPTTDRAIPKRKPITSKEITVSFSAKKLVIPILTVTAFAIVGLFLWHPWAHKEPPDLPMLKPSIAVLPFEDLSPQKNQGYFCDGMANSIINALSHVKGLSVRARGSSFSFKGKPHNLQEIGSALNVSTVLEGTVEKAGNRIRLTAQLINVADEFLIWSEQYNQELSNVFDIQDEITKAIVENMRLQLLGEEKVRLTKHHTENVEAFSLYSQGIYYLNRRTGVALENAIDYFNQAIAKDPDYALAYVGLADSYNTINFYTSVQLKDSFLNAEKAALRALEIDDSIGEAHNSLAYAKYRWYWDWDAADKEFKRAITLNPNYAAAHFWYGEYLLWQGRFEEAVIEIERALELDPISLVINSHLGWAYMLTEKLDRSLTQLHKTVQMDPSFAMSYFILGWTYMKLEKFTEAIEAFKTANEWFGGVPLSLSALGLAYSNAGEKEIAIELLDIIDTFYEDSQVEPFHYAVIHGGLGDKDKAFYFLEKAYEERSELMAALKVYSGLDPLRSDPRFDELLRKMNLK
jgi:serine/threonine-protein kinase